ncbi:serine carboxypeptidase-like 17 [Euphorbia lathyris]|uniref:serine carboxypeptidase-like 17 n=1 Tax=Euphorbia lathyris TaxID=212925 RepID=UPI0033141001
MKKEMMMMMLLFLLSISKTVVSQKIVKTLPGFQGSLPFMLETGYVGVGEKEEVQMFYYFFESENNAEKDPLLAWITGGPGCSVLTAVLYQSGPIMFNYTNSRAGKPSLVLNPYSWTMFANILYLDFPVGTGFSYATTREGYRISDLISAKHVNQFLRKWLRTHPKFLSNPFFFGGDSYSGILVPTILQEISKGNDKGSEPKINLKGFMLGNPLTDYKYDLGSRIEFAHKKQLISDQLYKEIEQNCKSEYLYPDRSNQICVTGLQIVNETFKKVYTSNLYEPKCSHWDLGALLGETDFSSILDNIDVNIHLSFQYCRDYMLLFSYYWANDKNVQRALHIREGTIKVWPRRNASLWYNFDVPSTVEYHRELSKRGYQALIFSGDADSVIPYLGTYQWIQSLHLPIKKNWHPWFVDHQVVGYAISYSKKKYNLTFVTVKGGGHSAQETRPKECFAMVNRWFSNYYSI